MRKSQIRVKGAVPPEIVAAITAALSRGGGGSTVEKTQRSAWAQAARVERSWRQNGQRRWRDGLRR